MVIKEIKTLPAGKHDSERREGGSVLLQGFELIPQFHHGLRHHALLRLILGFQIRQGQLSCLQPQKQKRPQDRTFKQGLCTFHTVKFKQMKVFKLFQHQI